MQSQGEGITGGGDAAAANGDHRGVVQHAGLEQGARCEGCAG